MQQKFANVIVDITHEKLDRIFQYRIPESLEGKLTPGMAVEVPFGAGNRLIRAYVISLTDHADYELEKLKEIQGVREGEIGAESRLIALAAWMKDHPGVKQEDIPSELLTASGSGLDPHITVQGARVQVGAVMEASGLTEDELNSIIDRNTTGKTLGIFGEETVNVLGCNLDIAEALGMISRE